MKVLTTVEASWTFMIEDCFFLRDLRDERSEAGSGKDVFELQETRLCGDLERKDLDSERVTLDGDTLNELFFRI